MEITTMWNIGKILIAAGLFSAIYFVKNQKIKIGLVMTLTGYLILLGGKLI